jgi:hypothetical protein
MSAGTRSIPALQALGGTSLLRLSQDSLFSITRQIVVCSELLHTEDSGAPTLSHKTRAHAHTHTHHSVTTATQLSCTDSLYRWRACG